MTIELVYRVRCSGPCRRWLSFPDDYKPGEDIPLAALEPKPTAARAGLWPDEHAARRAAFAAGWSSGTCPDCRATEQDAPRREPHPTEADVRHALAVSAKFHGQDEAQPETDNPRTVCICGHTRGEHIRVGGPFGKNRLLCDSCDPDSTENLVCEEFEAL